MGTPASYWKNCLKVNQGHQKQSEEIAVTKQRFFSLQIWIGNTECVLDPDRSEQVFTILFISVMKFNAENQLKMQENDSHHSS